MKEPKLCPSMMCADIFSLRETIRLFERCRIPCLHIDVMDGVFVPNLMLGTAFVSRLREAAPIPLDLHLMIEDPGDKLDWFGPGPGDYVSVHVESAPHLHRVLEKIRSRGARPLAALNPATPLGAVEEVLPDLEGVLVMAVDPGFSGQPLIPGIPEKIRRLRALLEERGLGDREIEVDGNVSLENAPLLREAGASMFVAGSSLLFAPGSMEDMEQRIRGFYRALEKG